MKMENEMAIGNDFSVIITPMYLLVDLREERELGDTLDLADGEIEPEFYSFAVSPTSIEIAIQEG